ncbi:TRAP transporter small permease [Desulfovibrio mangrovi]|uniref:TRAP transporter small permease n=1 Tax=Desulfovibrio mangrovi TaxID=2976983 RepID=UPI002248706E|nr:TRAP transporter small permease [Desulfovibrio mangrovi]UZP65816.1 TRAP transporter small permease [Desulfovibrio mangrovi]
MEKLLKSLNKVLFWISVSSMAVMLVLIFMQVITRYIFNHTFEWSEELARFLFVWVVFLGSALIMGEGGHLAVQLLPRKFEGTAVGHVMNLFINACSYAFILLLLVQGSKMTSVMTFQTAPGLGISMSWVYAIIPVSACLMMLYLIRDTITIFKKIRGAGNSQEADALTVSEPASKNDK